MSQHAPAVKPDNTTRPILPSAHIDGAAPTFRGGHWSTPLIPAPRFGEEVWSVAGLDVAPREHRRVRFDHLSPEWSLISREVIYWRTTSRQELRGRVSAAVIRRFADRDLRAGTVTVLAAALRDIARGAATIGIGLPEQWNSDEIERLGAWLQEHAANGRRPTFASALRCLHEYGSLLTLGGIPGDPFADLNPRELLGLKSYAGTLRGRSVPPPVFAPLLKAALTYVEDCSADIIAAAKWRSETEQRWIDAPPERRPKRVPAGHPAHAAGYRSMVLWEAHQFIAEHGALPTVTATTTGETEVGDFSTTTFAAMTDNPMFRHNRRIVEQIRDMIRQGTPTRPGMLPLEVSVLEHTRVRWREEFCWASIHVEVQALRDAAMIVLIALTGMRVSEAQSIRKDGWRTTWHRHPAVRSQLIKHANGEPKSWWATPAVMRACEVLAQTSPPDAETLLASTFERAIAAESGIESQSALDSALNRFIRKVNTDPTLEGFDPIPAGWRYGLDRNTDHPTITPHALRFTLAAIGNVAAMGDAALNQQFKHSTHAMTWGYMQAGGSREWIEILSGREAREAITSTAEMMTSIWAGDEEPAGAGGRALASRVRAVLEESNVAPFEVDSPLTSDEQFEAQLVEVPALLALLRSLSSNMHFGVLNHCNFDPRRAVCGQSEQPVLTQCAPEHCANVVIPADQISVFSDLRDELADYANLRRTSDDQREVVQDRIRRLDLQIGGR